MNTVAEIIQKINGAELNLRDDLITEQFWFADEHVVATIGVEGGAMSAPIYDYSINTDESLAIGSCGKVLYLWTNLVLSDETLTVTCDGQVKCFSVKPYEKPKRWLP